MNSNRSPNYFELLGLPESFDIDPQELQDRWKTRAAQVHPDRFASGTAAEKRVAMQWSAQVNEAYRVLRDHVSRARYICELNGYPTGDRPGGELTPEFLEQQMLWRESLEEIQESSLSDDEQTSLKSRDALESLRAQVEGAREECVKRVATMIDAQCWPQAVSALQQWMFVDKFKQEIGRVKAAGS